MSWWVQRRSAIVLHALHRMIRPRLTWITLLLATSWSCATHIPESTTAPPGVPRVGWVMMTGDRENPDGHYVCQSEPRTEECVLAPSRPEQQVFVHVHFSFHPASGDEKYTGTIELDFMQGAQPLRPNASVKAGDKPAQTSVVGLVLSTPGSHQMTISLVAQGEQQREIRERVPVEVRVQEATAH